MDKVDSEYMEKFFDKVLSPLLDQVEKDFSKYKNYFIIKRDKKAVSRIWKLYKKQCDLVYSHMDFRVTALDRHKVASCFMYAILKYKFVRLNLYKISLPEDLLMVNEYLAATVAFNMVAMYHRKDGDEDFEIILPKTNTGIGARNDDYLLCLIKALYFIPSLRHYDAFAYANILFLLERYSETKCET